MLKNITFQMDLPTPTLSLRAADLISSDLSQYSTVFRVQKKIRVPSLKPLEINSPKAQ